jgi:type I restriction enzyme S subunit
MRETTLREILLDSRDGEWGKGELATGRVKMRVIRGTDFPDVRQGNFQRVPVRYLEQKHADRKRLRQDDILIETAGGTADRPTGRTLLVTRRVLDALGSDITCASFARFLRINKDSAEPQFVFWLLQHHYAQRNLRQFHLQHTGVARFQFTTFADTFPLQLPEREQQRRIASILGAYDDLIDVNRQRIGLLEEMARRLFDEWFVRFRFPAHEGHTLVDTTDGQLPLGWNFVPLGELCERITDGSHHSPPSVEVGQMMASVKDMRDWDFDLSECRRISNEHYEELVRNGCQPALGDILIAKDGANLNKHTFLMWRDMPLVLLSSIAILRPPKDFEREYLVALLKSDGMSEAIKQMKSGAAIPRIVLRDFKRLRVVVPPRNLRQAFHSLAGPMHELIRRITIANDQLVQSRDLLLPRLISGKVAISTAEDELEAVA